MEHQELEGKIQEIANAHRMIQEVVGQYVVGNRRTRGPSRDRGAD